ncbi:hypothetical protein GOE05_12715 [Sinorhizobium medicae]|nr:hypothetical protein [Sinorhizobium medicae]
MIDWLALPFDRLPTAISRFLQCSGRGCDQLVAWRLLPENVSGLDLISAVGALGSFFAVVAAVIAIAQNSKARNLATVIELTRQLAAEREKAHSAGIYGYSDGQFHAYQMAHLVEQASYIVNHRWVTGKSKKFLMDWLREEIPSMEEQPAYKACFDSAQGEELSELFKLRDRFAKERKEAARFERIHAAWRGK